MALGLTDDCKAVVLAIDIGSSYIKAHYADVFVDKRGKLDYEDRDCPFDNVEPRRSIVSGSEENLKCLRTTRSGHQHKLQYGRTDTTRGFQFINPKRTFLTASDEVDAAALARDTGFPPEAAVPDEDNWIAMKVTCGRYKQTVPMNDVFGGMVYDVLVDLHNLDYNCLLAVAVTLPNTISKAGRNKAHAIVEQQLKCFSDSLLSRNADPYIAIVPEGVAATRDLCTRDLRSASSLRVMTVDSGHSTLDISQMTLKCEHDETSLTNNVVRITDIVNTGNAFCGVKDISNAMLGKLPAAVLQRAIEETARTGCLQPVNQILEYADILVVKASPPGLPDNHVVSSTTSCSELANKAPVLCGTVREVSRVLSGPAQQAVKRNLLLGKLCGHPPPSVVYMTGGGGMVPALKEAVRSAVPPGTNVLDSHGGNRQSVAKGAFLLLFDGLRERCAKQQMQQPGVSTRSNKAVGPSSINSSNWNLLPDLWDGPLGCSIGVWSAFSPSAVCDIKSKDGLEDLKRRIAPAALLPGTDPAVPDPAARQRHQQQMQQYIDYRIRGSRGPAPAVDRDIPFYYSLLQPNSPVPCDPVKLPWKLMRPSQSDMLRIQLVRLDPLAAEVEVYAGDYEVAAPPHDHCVQLAVRVDAEGKLVCEAELKHLYAEDTACGQPLPVTTRHDKYAAQRRDRQQRVQQLPAHAQEFLRQLNREEAAAVAPLAVGAAPAAAAAAQPRQRQDVEHAMASAAAQGLDAQQTSNAIPRHQQQQLRRQQDSTPGRGPRAAAAAAAGTSNGRLFALLRAAAAPPSHTAAATASAYAEPAAAAAADTAGASYRASDEDCGRGTPPPLAAAIRDARRKRKALEPADAEASAEDRKAWRLSCSRRKQRAPHKMSHDPAAKKSKGSKGN